MNDPFALNPNVNFLLEMNNNPHINNPPNMVPVGSLGIPLFEDRSRGGRFEEERYHIRNPTYVPPLKMDIPKYEPIKFEPIKIETPSYVLPKFELFPKKNFWDKD